MTYRDELIANIANEDITLCACEGIGYIPVNNDEDIECPFHLEEAKALDRMTEGDFICRDEERKFLEMLTGGDDRDFIDGYAHEYLDSILYAE